MVARLRLLGLGLGIPSTVMGCAAPRDPGSCNSRSRRAGGVFSSCRRPTCSGRDHRVATRGRPVITHGCWYSWRTG